MQTGAVVIWQYKHWLNSRSYIWREKSGSFVRLVRHTKQYWDTRNYPAQLAIVQFDGNKRPSRVPLSELRRPTPAAPDVGDAAVEIKSSPDTPTQVS